MHVRCARVLEPPVTAHIRARHLTGISQVLRQFGELPQDLVDMQKYAAWKAADINKALRAGRQPTPGSSSSPIVADATHNALPSEPHSAVESDFAFPSAPAKEVDAPAFPGNTAQGALYVCGHLNVVRTDWLLNRSHHAVGTLQTPRWVQSPGRRQAAGDLLAMLAMSFQLRRCQISSLLPPTCPLTPRELRKPLQQVTQQLIQTDPDIREDRRSCTMRSTRAFLCAALWLKYSEQVHLQHACTPCAVDVAFSAPVIRLLPVR